MLAWPKVARKYTELLCYCEHVLQLKREITARDVILGVIISLFEGAKALNLERSCGDSRSNVLSLATTIRSS